LTLAEIIADIERQARNYGTVILPTDDAMRLRAVARAAVGWRSDTRDYADARLAAVVDVTALDAEKGPK
jgi:hypothetical protein